MEPTQQAILSGPWLFKLLSMKTLAPRTWDGRTRSKPAFLLQTKFCLKSTSLLVQNLTKLECLPQPLLSEKTEANVPCRLVLMTHSSGPRPWVTFGTNVTLRPHLVQSTQSALTQVTIILRTLSTLNLRTRMTGFCLTPMTIQKTPGAREPTVPALHTPLSNARY